MKKRCTLCNTLLSSLLLIPGCSDQRVPPKPDTRQKTLTDQEKKERNIMKNFVTYTPKENLKPTALIGISDAQIYDHWNLYLGYVKNVNQLNQDLLELTQKNSSQLIIADRRRRYGFEYNGMVLHEYYFGNLKSNSKKLDPSTQLYQALEKTWGSFDAWQNDFINTGKTRGIGWAILYMDPTTKQLTNHFIADHEMGHISGFTPILVMDVWEHAYMVDHKAGGRADYITAFLTNINWEVVQNRYTEGK